MAFVSITRLKLRSVFNLFAFMRANEASVKELKASNGLIAANELIDQGLVFWTGTLWVDQQSMQAFRNSEPHRKAMQKLAGWCSEASYVHWSQDELLLPGWQMASQKLFNEGRLSKVRHPSANQLSGNFPAIKWTKTERVIKAPGIR